jgi:hypothetical protein
VTFDQTLGCADRIRFRFLAHWDFLLQRQHPDLGCPAVPRKQVHAPAAQGASAFLALP